jgi:multidrug resistance efflux pump
MEMRQHEAARRVKLTEIAISNDSYRVTAYFEETTIPAVHLGAKAKIYLLNDAPPLSGHVERDFTNA